MLIRIKVYSNNSHDELRALLIVFQRTVIIRIVMNTNILNLVSDVLYSIQYLSDCFGESRHDGIQICQTPFQYAQVIRIL